MPVPTFVRNLVRQRRCTHHWHQSDHLTAWYCCWCSRTNTYASARHRGARCARTDASTPA
jgi:hypothetical protein